MSLVNDQEGDSLRDPCQNLGAKVLVAQPLGRNQQNVHVVSPQAFFGDQPFVSVVRSNPDGAYSHTLGGCNLIPHQRQQRGDEKRRSRPGLAQQLGCNEVDEALAPPCFLHDKESSAAFHDVTDGAFLPFAEVGIVALRARPQQLAGTSSGVPHESAPPSRVLVVSRDILSVWSIAEPLSSHEGRSSKDTDGTLMGGGIAGNGTAQRRVSAESAYSSRRIRDTYLEYVKLGAFAYRESPALRPS